MRRLVEHKAQLQPLTLRGSFRVILARRWWAILSLAVQRAVAGSLVGADWPARGVTPLPGIEELLSHVEGTEPSQR